MNKKQFSALPGPDEPYAAVRDHEAGIGAWKLYGPGVNMPCERNIGVILAKVLSGKVDDRLVKFAREVLVRDA